MSDRIEIPSYVSSDFSRSSFGPDELHSDSVIIDDGGVPFLIGHDARKHSWDSTRIFGGHLEVPQYRNLVRALVAKTLKEGDHQLSIAMSASHLWVEEMRESPKSIYLNSIQDEILRDTLKLIRYKTSAHSKVWKECRVEILERPKIYHELAAVSFVIPKDTYKNYALWQLGHGDLQQIVFVDGNPMTETVLRTEGVSFAVKKLGEILGFPNLALADEAWRKEKVQAQGEMNGKTKDCVEEKRKAIIMYFSQQVIGKFINALNPYKQKVTNIILSGGGAKDQLMVEVLREQVEKLGFQFHPINTLPKMDSILSEAQRDRLSDPLFTCVEGLCTKAPLGFDVGNSTLKAKWGGKDE